MAVKLKKLIQKYLEPNIIEHGFQFDEKSSSSGEAAFVYYKGDSLERLILCEEFGVETKREEIIISKSRFAPEIDVRVISSIKRGDFPLRFIADGSRSAKHWPIATEEKALKSMEEIVDCLDKAWDWFALK